MEVRLDEIQLLRAEIERLRTEIRELKERYGENDPMRLVFFGISFAAVKMSML